MDAFDGRRRRSIVAAALVACYGILCLIATGPHSHNRTDARFGDGAYERSFSRDATDGTAGDPGGVRSDCPLCSWSRGLSRPQAGHVASAPCVVRVHRHIELEPADAAPPTVWKPLRAPPAA
ncbi:MAG: hypothetical protein ACREAA_08870 [Candidatus Polarisedimenticolia bacterium]